MSIPASGDQLLVSERFVSLQGEGISAGAPAAFLRLGNCNLSCVYCDTPYTWDQSRFDLKVELQALSIAELSAWVIEEAPGRLIITGGEPLIQHKQLVRLLDEVDGGLKLLEREALYVEVETNGTILPAPALFQRIDQWNVSPKLAVSVEPEARRIKEDVLSGFAERDHAYFKFVVASKTDVDEVESLIELHSLPRSRVLLMPEAAHPEQLKQRAPLVADWALSHRLRYSGRLHLELYGGRRGT